MADVISERPTPGARPAAGRRRRRGRHLRLRLRAALGFAGPVAASGALAGLLVATAIGCGPRDDRGGAAPAGAAALEGAWTITLTLTQPPLTVDTARLRAAGRDRVRGTLTLAPNRWLRRTHAVDATGAPLAVGVHDVDLTPFGVDVRRTEFVPLAIVEALRPAGAATATGQRPDSLAILLVPSADVTDGERFEARVRWSGDALRGTWRLHGSGRGAATASGTLVAARAGATGR